MNILNPNRNFQIEVDGEVFYGKIPLPSQNVDIDISIARRMNGVPLESFPSSTYGYLVAVKTLDSVITEKPRSFTDKFKSFEEVEDTEYVIDLYNQYVEQKARFYEEGKKNRDERSSVNESRTNPGSVSNAEVSNSDKQEHYDDSGSIPVPKTVHYGSNVAPGGLHDLSGENRNFQKDQRNREDRSSRMDSQAPSSYPGGGRRVHKRDNHQRG